MAVKIKIEPGRVILDGEQSSLCMSIATAVELLGVLPLHTEAIQAEMRRWLEERKTLLGRDIEALQRKINEVQRELDGIPDFNKEEFE